jgi:hypothetical protein
MTRSSHGVTTASRFLTTDSVVLLDVRGAARVLLATRDQVQIAVELVADAGLDAWLQHIVFHRSLLLTTPVVRNLTATIAETRGACCRAGDISALQVGANLREAVRLRVRQVDNEAVVGQTDAVRQTRALAAVLDVVIHVGQERAAGPDLARDRDCLFD